jgi:hypothetical protein
MDKGYRWRVMIRYRKMITCLLVLGFLLSACASAPAQVVIQASPTPPPTQTLAPSSTPDLCAPNNIRKEIKKVYDFKVYPTTWPGFLPMS